MFSRRRHDYIMWDDFCLIELLFKIEEKNRYLNLIDVFVFLIRWKSPPTTFFMHFFSFAIFINVYHPHSIYNQSHIFKDDLFGIHL